ncbi:MAG: GNAT family N-acetyltransferase [Candidatus Omnitrophica bacterium]|nr:GNAT family N-acetyltransferase [Candidatus Omnitrophota bacterium]
MKIGRAFSSEYEDIQRILEDVYGHGFNYFPSAYPSVWKKINTDFENIFVIKEKGKIVSLVRIFPLKTVQGGVDITLAGIGAVSTLYPYRGKGYMSLLLHHTFKEMEKQHFPLSVLGGDRHRYNTFGYETAGKVIELTISTRGLNRHRIKAIPSYRYDFTDMGVIAKIMEVSKGLLYRKKRTKSEFEDIYRRQGINVYYAEQDRKFAFLVISATEVKEGGTKKVFECGGDPELIPGILQHLVERFGFTAFNIKFPDFTDIPENIMSLASSWNIRPCFMIKIISLKETMEILSKRKDFLFPDSEEITLTVKNKESIIISKKGSVLKIESGRGKNEISLTDIDMVRLLFGSSFWFPEGTTDIKTVRVLRQFLPINIYLPLLDMI